MLINHSISKNIYTIIQGHVDKREHIDLEGAFEDIGVGSLHFVKIMVEIEIQYEVEIDNKYYTDEYKNIGDFINKITDYLSADGEYYGN